MRQILFQSFYPTLHKLQAQEPCSQCTHY